MRLVLILALLLFAIPCAAQIPVPLTWDPSVTPSPPENPVNYKVYRCTDETTLMCTGFQAGTGTTYDATIDPPVSTVWFYVTAWNYDLESETNGVTKLHNVRESGKSNILRVTAYSVPEIPPDLEVDLDGVPVNSTVVFVEFPKEKKDKKDKDKDKDKDKKDKKEK